MKYMFKEKKKMTGIDGRLYNAFIVLHMVNSSRGKVCICVKICDRGLGASEAE